ncbi:hypothetical protein SAY86_020233 [Trapa natans]|uniref:MLO-like protein n=1 Tax=Trapa natans TaxID=22666 RepID=A0AAN7R1L1_TRANT|nr:hypothetical protein SAY86_020233 [Trapa natans]
MAASTGERTLEVTTTWAVVVVCIVLVLISIIIEHIIHLAGKVHILSIPLIIVTLHPPSFNIGPIVIISQWLNRKRKRALYKAFEKIKSEFMLLGFISLLLTVGQGLITNICISEKVGSTWHPCSNKEFEHHKLHGNYGDTPSHGVGDRRRLLSVYGSDEGTFRRVLAAAAGDKCAARGKVPFVSAEGIHQLHIFIFVLAVFHVVNCILTVAPGRVKVRKWSLPTRTPFIFVTLHYITYSSESLRHIGETSFGRKHLNLWTKKPLFMWMVCFFRHFVKLVSVAKVDYLTLRHGFIMAHLAPQSHPGFDFHKYIKSPLVWFFAVIFLLSNTHGWHSHLWLPFVPFMIMVLVGTKLQSIVTKMGLKIEERGEIVKGVPVVQPGDELFWFNRPRLMLYLINFILFQNAFQFAFFALTSYEFGLKSCFHDHPVEKVIRISTGVLVQFLCSYITLPLYALVTQMGSTMKPTIFNDRVAMALRKLHKGARKNVRESRRGASVTPPSSQPTTPSHHTQLTWWHRRSTSVDSFQSSPRKSSYDVEAVVEPHSTMDQELALADTFMVTIDEYESLEHTQNETNGGEASACSDHGDNHGGEGHGECREQPVAEPSACMQHVIQMEPAGSANGQLQRGVMGEIESVDGSYP